MSAFLNQNNQSLFDNGGLEVQKINQKNDIIDALHNNLETTKIVPSEVQSTLLCSNNYVSDCTSLGGRNEGLKLLLKDLALKIIEQEYERIRN